jgi:aldose 1-epimerase
MSITAAALRDDGVIAVTVETPALRFRLVSLGATVTSVQVKQSTEAETKWVELTAAFDSLEEQLADDAYMGATCGRFTGRIAAGKFTLDGAQHQLTINNNGNTLHGGTDGFNRRIWELAELLDGSERCGGRLGAIFRLSSPHNDQGFPAALSVTAAYYTIPAAELPELHMKFGAEIENASGSSTVVNIVNHNYWNLNGCVRGSPDEPWPQPLSVENHVLQIDADFVTAADEHSVCTGDLLAVDGTPFDFRRPTPIGARSSHASLSQSRAVPGYDDCFVLASPHGAMRKVATIVSPVTGISMDVLTTFPALQVYTTNYKPKHSTGSKGDRFGFRSAVCLETQFLPNAPNCPKFPSTVVKLGEKWEHETIYRLSC